MGRIPVKLAISVCLLLTCALKAVPVPDGSILAGEYNAGYTFTDPSGDVSGANPNCGFDITFFGILYDDLNDDLYIAIGTDGIAGDADGDGDPAAGVDDLPHYGSDPDEGLHESFGVLFDFDRDGTGDYIVGVTPAGAYPDQLGVYPWTGGATADFLDDGSWNLAGTATYAIASGSYGDSPWTDKPDLEFVITDATTAFGILFNPSALYDATLVNGMAGDLLGEDDLFVTVPEPSGLALLAMVTLGLQASLRRRRAV